MPQLHLYVPEELAQKVRQKAESMDMTVSKYLAELVKKEIGTGWPAGYFEKVCGQWQGDFPALVREKPEPVAFEEE